VRPTFSCSERFGVGDFWAFPLFGKRVDRLVLQAFSIRYEISKFLQGQPGLNCQLRNGDPQRVGKVLIADSGREALYGLIELYGP
jgi:hypothetical protein